MEEQLREIVAKIAETKPTFGLNASLREELKLDSVRAFEVIFEIERNLSVTIPEERYAELMTFADLVNVVTSLKG